MSDRNPTHSAGGEKVQPVDAAMPIGCGYAPLHDYLRRKYPDPLTDENRLLYYMEAAELYGQELRYAPELLPCNERCPKCGSLDIHRLFRPKGDKWHVEHFEEGPHTKYTGASGWDTYAKRDHIEHHCRTCQFDWQGAVLPKAKKT